MYPSKSSHSLPTADVTRVLGEDQVPHVFNLKQTDNQLISTTRYAESTDTLNSRFYIHLGGATKNKKSKQNSKNGIKWSKC